VNGKCLGPGCQGVSFQVRIAAVRGLSSKKESEFTDDVADSKVKMVRMTTS